MGKGNGKCSPSAEQFFGIDVADVLGSAPHPLYFHLLEYLNDGKYSPSIMFLSLPSICNDGKHFLPFLSSFPFEASAMTEKSSNLYLTKYGQKKILEINQSISAGR
jgi:hypothetical protein